MRRLLRQHPLLSFYVLTLMLTWSLWSLPVLHQLGIRAEPPPPWWQLGSFGPSVAGLIMSAVLGRLQLRRLLSACIRWRVGWRWYLAAFVLPPLFLIFPLLLHLSAGDPLQIDDLQSPVVLLPLFLQIFFLGGPLNEELGWRGFALPALQQKYSALAASLAIGAMWAVWHIPLFIAALPGYTTIPFHWYVVEVLGLSIIFTWLYNSSRGSVLMAILLHATWNTTLWYTFPMWGEQAGRNMFAFVAALWIFAGLLIWLHGSEHLSNRERHTMQPQAAKGEMTQT